MSPPGAVTNKRATHPLVMTNSIWLNVSHTQILNTKCPHQEHLQIIKVESNSPIDHHGTSYNTAWKMRYNISAIAC